MAGGPEEWREGSPEGGKGHTPAASQHITSSAMAHLGLGGPQLGSGNGNVTDGHCVRREFLFLKRGLGDVGLMIVMTGGH